MVSKIDVGAQRNNYRGSQLRKNEIIFLIFSFLFLSLIPFLIGFYRTLYGYAQYGTVAAKYWGALWFGFSVFFLILIVSYGLYRLNITKLCISVHTSGINIKRPLRNDHTILWDQVTDLYFNLERSILNRGVSRTYCIIHTTDNKRLSLRASEIENLLDLITQIKSSVYIHQYPRIRESYRIGNAISFGPIEIQKNYLKIKRYSYISASPRIFWKDIDLITIKSGYLLVKLQNQKHYQLKAAKIPNIEILLRLIEDRARD